MSSRQPMPLPLGTAIVLDLVLGACAIAAATLNLVISADGFIRGDMNAGVGGILLGIPQGLIAALLVVGAFRLWRRHARGLLMSTCGAILVFTIAWQAAEARDFIPAAALFASSLALATTLMARSTKRALGDRRREPGGS